MQAGGLRKKTRSMIDRPAFGIPGPEIDATDTRKR